MTAISAAIVELEAWREKLSRLIADLRLHDRAIELSYPAKGDVAVPPPPRAAAPTAIVTARPHGSSRSTAATPSATPPVRRNGRRITALSSAVSSELVAALVATMRPMKTLELVAATKRPEHQVRAALKELVRARRVTKTGATNTLRYALPHVSAKPKADDGLETVWNGTKERNGQAPPLSGARLSS